MITRPISLPTTNEAYGVEVGPNTAQWDHQKKKKKNVDGRIGQSCSGDGCLQP